jgi:protein-S-isoprenylcysteine O-methyltransferase Ste14
MDSENIYRIVALLLLAGGMSISIYYRSQANRSGDDIDPSQEGPLILTLRRLFGLSLWISALVYLINPSWMAWSSLALPVWVRWSGGGLLAMSIPLTYWVFSSLGKNVTPTVVTRREHSLVTHGPYRWVRHPLYSVGFMAFAGLSLLAANWFIPLALALTYVTLVLRTPIEEERLIEKFGDQYRDYKRRTGRYLPRLRSS